jgi:hypothetical protein
LRRSLRGQRKGQKDRQSKMKLGAIEGRRKVTGKAVGSEFVI